jgi:hypothetical protein
MNTEVYIENNRADITKEVSALLNLAIDDIKNFSARSTTWSRTIVLPGTANNNKLFGHIFQVGQSNNYSSAAANVGSNFNAAKAASCIIFQDQIQTFKGVLRLLQVNYYGGFNGAVEYEVSVFGTTAGLNVALSGSLLEDLDFSAYNHTYNDANIVASWDNPGGSGYYYPLIDHGTYSTLKHDWDIRTFRPALYAREYIDKMFTAAGYRWSSALFNTPGFKSLIIPYNRKNIPSQGTRYIDVKSTGQVFTPVSATKINFPTTVQLNGFTPSDANQHTFNYDEPASINPNLIITLSGTYYSNGIGLTVGIFKQTGSDPEVLIGSTTLVSTFGTTLTPFSITLTTSDGILQNDDVFVRIYGFNISVSSVVNLTAGAFIVEPANGVSVEISVGDDIVMNSLIPKNIRQIDVLVGIVKLYNLYVYEDKFDEKLIYITPFIDFYSKNFSNAVDWTHKLNNNKPIKSKPMAELNAKIYKFKFKPDSDYYNELYKKRYNEGYGDRIYDSEFEFSQQVKEFEIVFSATPMVGYVGEDKVYSTIFKQSNNNEETVDYNIRLLQSKKVTGVTSWSMKDGATVLNTLTKYGYAGHFDNPDVPTSDLNFGATRELFFVLTAGSINNNQFNVYWSNYMRETTDKDSKLVSAHFYLTAKDILNLDFSKYIYVNGIAYRLNSISNYNVSSPDDCEVELFKVNSAAYTEQDASSGPPEGCFLLWSDENTLDYDDGEELLYGDCNTNPGDGTTPPPDTVFYLNWEFKKTSSGGGLALGGVMRVYKNGSLQGFATAPDTGTMEVTAGDEIQVVVAGSPGKVKRVLVTNDIDGVVYDHTTTLVNNSYTFTIGANKNYSTIGEYNQ